MTRLNITPVELKEKRREGDGICTLCFVWSDSTAEPWDEQVYCHNCENRSVVGIDKAIGLGIVDVKVA